MLIAISKSIANLERVGDEAARVDFQATLRGVRKNLILLDIFVYDLKNEPFYEKAREAVEKIKKEKPQ